MDIGNDTVNSTNYTIRELDEDSSYLITVKASNAAGSSAVSFPIIAMTEEAGNLMSNDYYE